MVKLRTGVRLSAINCSGGEIYEVGPSGIDGLVDVKEITVSQECGQMAEVPWADVAFTDGTHVLVNLAFVESVTLVEVSDA